MRIRQILLTLALVAVVGIGSWIAIGPGDESAAEGQRTTWQVETDVWKDDLPAFLETIDASCDLDIEPQGVSAYIVAYRCLE